MELLNQRQEDNILDLTGLMCPLPIVITSEKMKKLKEGEILKVISSDPGFEKDIHNWCQQTKNELLNLEQVDGKVLVTIRKKSEAIEPSLWYWIKFHSLGVKLHIRHVLMELNPFMKKPDHFITFCAISEGTRAEKYLKGKEKLIPIPDEIDPRCGVVLAVKGYERAKQLYDELYREGFCVEAIYKKEGKNYSRVFP